VYIVCGGECVYERERERERERESLGKSCAAQEGKFSV